ncbi:MAG: chemotaxis protein CheX [Acidobacteriia bacterium]|nr:chemotaxis protein CheX [Terriglobia bacterium]
MLSVDLGSDETTTEPAGSGPNDGVVSFIGLAGSWVGTGSIVCSPTLACRICSQMLQTESTAVDEEVLDAVAELTNMIIGGVKTDLERHLGELGLSIPTVIFGKNFLTKSAGTAEWVVERFGWEGEILQVKLCLAPNEKSGRHDPNALGQTVPLDVKPYA